MFLLVKVNKLEITVNFSWWQFRKLTDKIRFIFFSFPQESCCAFESLMATANTRLGSRNTYSGRDGASLHIAVLPLLWLSGWQVSQASWWREDQTTEEERAWKDQTCFVLPCRLTCRPEPVIMQLIWRRRVGLLLYSLRLCWILCNVKLCPEFHLLMLWFSCFEGEGR